MLKIRKLPLEFREGFHCPELYLKNGFKMSGNPVLHLIRIHGGIQKFFQAGHLFICYTAGNDMVEVGEVGIYVEGETVHRHPA